MNEGEADRLAAPAIAASGGAGPIRLKWHKLRTRVDQAPFKLSNLALGWRLGASLEVDIVAAADGRFVVLHDATLGPSTTGRGRVGELPAAEAAGLLHRDDRGVPDPDAPVLTLGELLEHLRRLPRSPGANLQLDLKIVAGRPLSEASIADMASSAAGLGSALVIGSHHLEEARRVAEAVPGARLGYDPMLAASRDQGLLRNPERMLRHIEQRSEALSLAYLSYGAVLAAEKMGFPLVRRLLGLGIETDAWTVNPGPATIDSALRGLVEAEVRQITTDAPGLIAERLKRLRSATRVD